MVTNKEYRQARTCSVPRFHQDPGSKTLAGSFLNMFDKAYCYGGADKFSQCQELQKSDLIWQAKPGDVAGQRRAKAVSA